MRLRSAGLVLVGGLLGLVAGAGLLLGLQQPAAAPRPTGEGAAAVPKPLPLMGDGGVLLVWSPGGLSEEFVESVAGLPGVRRSSVMRGGLAELTRSQDASGRVQDEPTAGFVIPLDLLALDAGHAAFVAPSVAPAVAALGQGEALLGETSARQRAVGAGGALELAGGTRLDVVGVVDDGSVGAAEVAVTHSTARALGLDRPRAVLIEYRGDRAAVESELRGAAGVPLRIRGPGETPFLRHGDAVLPDALVKERFGEFAYRRLPGTRDVALDPKYEREHIIEAEVPLVGRVRCHRGIMEQLRGAMGELERRNLGWLVDPDGFAGCHAARLTSSQEQVSRHAWGIAFDLNLHKNPTGTGSAQDPRLVETLAAWGFTWGGEWLVPDPAHFEFLRDPR